ncbi:PREDICTED: mavicyanin-like [Lupinus angustifolius]|uniref:mavicyanin-like n=1 Tax=Lupinus angustifolius TaxID=3871 RepID=UPI00092E9E8D|nr:PREDICTED: mavicyanin-like [Lupinus angustifolius]
MIALFKASFLLFLCFFTLFCVVNSTDFEVGGKDGWIVPNSKDYHQMYNQWASKNRFKIGDTIFFKYKKDSVMGVTEKEYEKCRSSHPHFFSNNGDTVFKFERPGLFYFISGVSGHCDRGQKMIIKVLDIVSAPPPESQSANDTATKPHHKGAAAEIAPMSITTLALSVFSFLVFLFA